MSEVMQTIPSWIAFIFHCGICCAQGILAAQHAMIAKKLRPPLLIVPNCLKKLVLAHVYIILI